MDSSKNRRWTSPFKKISRLRVKILTFVGIKVLANERQVFADNCENVDCLELMLSRLWLCDLHLK